MKEILFAAFGSVLAVAILYVIGLVGRTPQLLVPSGAVIAYEGARCPDGWSEYTKGNGRVIVGSDDKTFTVGAKGGESKIHINAINLPPHSHKQKLSGGVGALPGFLHTPNQSWGHSNHGNNIEHRTDNGVGQGMPLDNMQPWVSLRFCSKN